MKAEESSGMFIGQYDHMTIRQLKSISYGNLKEVLKRLEHNYDLKNSEIKLRLG